MISNDIKPLNVKDLLSTDKYRIPIYQRNYDWGEKESLQLLEDIADYASSDNDKKYYIGSVVVFTRSNGIEEYYETIDGQQRLTTLTILMNVLRSINELKLKMDWFKCSNLSYDHRDEANESIRLLTDEVFLDHPSTISISEVYHVIKKNLVPILESKKNLNLTSFVEYLLSKVIIMRIPVPQDTELNHYFEIMNSRGEQLEKHEVLKASLMSYLEEDQYCLNLFNDIWEACADMNTYVQMNMRIKLRSSIFSDNWSNFQCDVFDNLLKKILADKSYDINAEDGCINRSLSELFVDAEKNVKYEIPKIDDNNGGGSDRFGSIINFPNFLLQVLKIMYHDEKDYQKDIDVQIKLDDKRIIEIFDNVLNSFPDKNDKKAFVKRYVIALLKIRYMFDSFIIKRENYGGKEGWSLKKLKKYDNNNVNYVGTFSGEENEDDVSKDIRMLEAMFHVSAPTLIYKHWLNAVLYYVYTEKEIKQNEMREKLYTLACTYMMDRYLCEQKTDFEIIIYEKKFETCNNIINWDSIDCGCDVENFIFNFYDYVTWKQNPSKYPKFEFTYRTSVEHFYPQHAIEGHEQLDDNTGLNKFGNICLISRGMNSRFSNDMPKAKLENFGNIEEVKNGLSLKLLEMMDVVRSEGDWGKDEIEKFEKFAREKILKALQEKCENIRIDDGTADN